MQNLSNVRSSYQDVYDSDEEPDEHMQPRLESLGTLSNCFNEVQGTISSIEQELELINQWIAETGPAKSVISQSTYGDTEPKQEKYSTRSIFDDIDEN